MIIFDELVRELRKTLLACSMQHAGEIALTVCEAILDRTNELTPDGAMLIKIVREDGKLTVCMGKGDAAPRLGTAYDAVKETLYVDMDQNEPDHEIGGSG